MKSHFKGSLKVLLNYLIMLIIFFVFLPVGISYLWAFCIFLFIEILYFYSEFNDLALKERKPTSNVVHYPLKGFVMGLLGMAPIALITLVVNILDLGTKTANDIKLGILRLFLGPTLGLYTTNYLIFLIFPLAIGLGYLTGFYGVTVSRLFRRKLSKKAEAKLRR